MRAARAVLAAGVVVILLLGGLTTVLVDSARPAAAAPASVDRDYVTSTGDSCALTLDPRVLGAGDPALRMLAILELRRIDLGALRMSRLGAVDEVFALTAALEDHLGSMLRVRSHPMVHIVLDARATCTPRTAALVAPAPTSDGGTEDRPISDLGGRAPDGAGFILTSVGELCEIQVTIDVDGRNPAVDTDAARERLREVREFFRSLDFSSVDYSAQLSEQLATPLHDPARPADAEMFAWWSAATAMIPPTARPEILTTQFQGWCGEYNGG